MSSKKAEDVHSTLLKKLLSDSGLECVQSPAASLDFEEEESETEEEEGEPEAEPAVEESTVEEETTVELGGEFGEEISQIFPSPSLRRLIPERLRRIEAHNRIHVLPEKFSELDIDPAAIPKINTTAQQKYIDILADMIGCKNYKNNLPEYWVVDTLANLLRRAQEDDLHRPSQVALIHWYCEWIKEMQHFDAADRQRMVRRWKDNMLTAAKCVAEDKYLPYPFECDVFYKVPEEEVPKSKRVQVIPKVGKMEQVEDPELGLTMKLVWKHSSFGIPGHEFDCCLRDLTKIAHYIYDLFSTDYQYDLIRSVFCHSPDYSIVDPPFQLQVPKRLYAPLKAKPKPKSPGKKEKVPTGKKGKKEPDTEEYIALMQLKAKDMLQQEELEERDREDWNRRSHILPLNFAATDELFDSYWPPPPPEPAPAPAPDKSPERKAEKGKKK